MDDASAIPRLTNIVEAIERIRSEMAGISLDAFEEDWRRQWAWVAFCQSAYRPVWVSSCPGRP